MSYGARLNEVLVAAKILEKYKLSSTIADARFCKPLDKKLISELVKNHRLLITVEEGSIGGFGSHVLNFLIKSKIKSFQNILIDTIEFPDVFIEHDTPYNMYAAAKMNGVDIARRVLKKLNYNIKKKFLMV